MSSIVFDVSPGGALVAVDTMCTDANGAFRYHVSKAFAVPHLNLVVAVTGWLDLAERFVAALNRCGFVEHDEVALHASDILAEIWKDRHAGLGEPSAGSNPDIVTSTIFQFGYSASRGAFEVVQYASGDDFRPQRATDVAAHKPPAPLVGEPEQGDAEIVRIMRSQRLHEQRKPPEGRVHIGGSILVFVIDHRGIAIQRIHTFD